MAILSTLLSQSPIKRGYFPPFAGAPSAPAPSFLAIGTFFALYKEQGAKVIQSKTVFLVDDEPTILHLLSDFLRSKGYAVQCFESVDQALTELEEAAGTTPEAIISDVRMVPLSGLDLLRTVRSRFPNIPVILISAFHDWQTRNLAHTLGAYSFLNKPFALSKLEGLLGELGQQS